MIDETARFSLPLLAAGQAHKEIFHNEALLLIDFLMHPVVEEIRSDPSGLEPLAGQCWIIDSDPAGPWLGMADYIAGWADGGWRFIPPQPGMSVLLVNSGFRAIFEASGWTLQTAIAPPAGGAIVDGEARAAIESILHLLQSLRFLPLSG